MAPIARVDTNSTSRSPMQPTLARSPMCPHPKFCAADKSSADCVRRRGSNLNVSATAAAGPAWGARGGLRFSGRARGSEVRGLISDILTRS